MDAGKRQPTRVADVSFCGPEPPSGWYNHIQKERERMRTRDTDAQPGTGDPASLATVIRAELGRAADAPLKIILRTGENTTRVSDLDGRWYPDEQSEKPGQGED